MKVHLGETKKIDFLFFFLNQKFYYKKLKKIKISFLDEFDKIWKREKIDQNDLFFNNKKIPFCGGWFVYLGYELVEEIETKLNIPESPFKLPTAFASRVNTAIIFDHIDNEILITSDDKDSFFDDILDIEEDFTKILDENRKLSGTIKILTKGSEYEHQEQVRKCIDYIFQGEIFQANLSRLWKFQIDKKINEIDIYRQLRNKNPSPFAGLINYEDSNIICSSPERLVSVNGDI